MQTSITNVQKMGNNRGNEFADFKVIKALQFS